MDTPLFYIFLFVHLVSLLVGFGSVIVIDSFGFLWLLKKVQLSFVMRVAETTQKLIWIGWSGMVFSGLFLITAKGYVDNLTKIKIFFVLLVGLNGIFLHLLKKAFEKIQDGSTMPNILMFRMAITTLISQTGWWGALLIGFVHRHLSHNIPWPSSPYTYMVVWVIFLIVLWGSGELMLRNSKVGAIYEK